jgi:competence protein ComEA
MRYLVISMLCMGAIATVQAQTPSSKLTDTEGKAVFERICTICHDVEGTIRSRNTRERWGEIVDDMASRGAEATDEEFDQILDYLARNFSKDKPAAKVNVNKAAAGDLASALSLSKESASAIVEYREKNGPFKEWQDLKKVSVIDMNQIERKKDQLEF